MLRCRRLTRPVDMGDSSYYALTADAKQLAAVVITGAGAGVLTGLSTYEVALADAKIERKALIARVRDGIVKGEEMSGGAATLGDGSKYCSGDKRTDCTDFINLACRLNNSNHDEVKRNNVRVFSSEEERNNENERLKLQEIEEAVKMEIIQKERAAEIEKEKIHPLDDMSKDELKEKVLPFLAGDLFLIWRETDLASEKEKNRIRNKLLRKEENLEGVSMEVIKERNRIDAMTLEERGEYEKDKREEVVYTMLQVKYGLDEEKIAEDAQKLRAASKGTNYSLISI